MGTTFSATVFAGLMGVVSFWLSLFADWTWRDRVLWSFGYALFAGVVTAVVIDF